MMSNLVFVLTVVLLHVTRYSEGAECHGKPDPLAKPNVNKIYTAPPKYVTSVKNGKLYTVGEDDDLVYLVHVWGNPYEMGYANGELMKDNASSMVHAVWSYLEDQVESAINGTLKLKIRDWFLKDVADFGLVAALDLEILATRKFTGNYFYEEIQGIADATGQDPKKIARIHMLGELTKGSCSMFGAWGAATGDGSLLQLRALDWNVDGPFKDYPQITVYHPRGNGSIGHAFANVGWTGWIGSIQGMNSKRMAISEIGASFPDKTFGEESRFGVPFTYLLRDILQFDSTIDDSINRIANSKRTCDLILGVGDGKLGEFRGIEYSASVANFYDDQNMKPEAEWHPKIQNIVYWGMDWLCPGYSEVLARQLNKYHGNLNAEYTIHDIVSIVQTGDLLVNVYDLTRNVMYVSNARATGESGATYAYERQFIRLDMDMLFKEIPPN